MLTGILSDVMIKDLVKSSAMISPFHDKRVADDVISYGLSSYGYDARLSPHFVLLDDQSSYADLTIDPKNMKNRRVSKGLTQRLEIRPHGFVLGKTMEYFKIPKDVISLCIGKSTYARCGLIVNVTPLEPGWEGYVTLELSNTTPYPVYVYAEEGIAQFLFLRGASPCESPYDGNYQKQNDITLPVVKAVRTKLCERTQPDQPDD